jgi:hypothetical protein
MRYSSIVVFIFVIAVAPPLASADVPLTPRPLDPAAAGIFERAVARSSSVRALVRELESSDVIVHIETCWQLPDGANGSMRFVTRSGGYRYVRITIAAGLPANSRTAILGHELQHAVEIARSKAGDVDSVRKLFESKGYRTRGWHDVFETEAAQRVEKAIRSELASRTTALEAEPVIKFDH